MKLKILLLSLLFCFQLTARSQPGFYEKLAEAAVSLTEQEVIYDPSYFSIDYPGGDVPANRGVCTDVIIRAYRLMQIDLQKEVHEDMRENFGEYPKHWGLSRPDPNIDHRRVPNLMTFFTRHGQTLPISCDRGNYKPGDIVCWDLGNGVTHIGIVTGEIAAESQNPLIVHNIGRGQVLEDCLFNFRITGHFRFGNR